LKDLNLLITAIKCILEKWGKYGENTGKIEIPHIIPISPPEE
jgi:hypothetical protein